MFFKENPDPELIIDYYVNVIKESVDYPVLCCFMSALLHYKPSHRKPIKLEVHLPKEIPKFANLEEQIIYYKKEIEELEW